jgi:predicted RNase H-like HicB family nuclease
VAPAILPALIFFLAPLHVADAEEAETGDNHSMRQIVIYPGDDGYWVTECPSLPGCVSQGKTREEAIANAREAIEAYIAALEEDNLLR